MNRIEFMNELERLLVNLPQEERTEAMQFYIDYFNDAGEENEQKVIEELESPEKVAATIKADIGGQNENSEYSETGYSDARFEQKQTPVQAEAIKKPWTSQPLKIVLVILIAIAACTVAWPIMGGIFGAAIGILIAAFCFFIALVIAAFCVMISGCVMAIIGLVKLAISIPAGLMVSGVGVLLFVLGLIATVATVKLCMIVYPTMIRGIVELIRKVFQGVKGKAVS